MQFKSDIFVEVKVLQLLNNLSAPVLVLEYEIYIGFQSQFLFAQDSYSTMIVPNMIKLYCFQMLPKR